jgi:multidrug efflux system membrane fusion protein
VRVVNDDDVVEFHAVNVISDGKDGTWVSGLPDSTRLITVGQEMVRAGEKVVPTIATANAGAAQ